MMENVGDKMTTYGGVGGGGDNRGSQWNPLLPSVMPWSTATPMMTSSQVVHFTAADHPMLANYGFVTNEIPSDQQHRSSMLVPKRKCPPLAWDELPPPKVHITDEQMANRMKGLQITSNMTSSHQQQTSPDDVTAMPSLVVCDEIRQLRMPENILPAELLAKLERPSKALVVWKPPEQRAAELLQQTMKSVQDKTEVDKKEDGNQKSKKSSFSDRPNASNRVLKKSKRKVETFDDLKKKFANKKDKTQENLDKLKALSESVVENTKATKFFKRASKLKEVEVEKVEEQTTIFTEEDFARFEREYSFD